MAEISLKQVNILMECGADFTMGIVIRDDSNSLVDLTGYTVTAQLREYAEAQDYMEFTATHNNAGGRITISMPHEDTAQISYTSGVYDVFIIDTNNISEKVVKGEVTVDPNVTKPIAGTIMYLVSFASEDDFPTTGEMRRLYFSHASRKMYRWNGTNYIGIITDGEAATVEVGTVTTLDAGEDATVENVGSLTNAVFDFGIPKGDPGTTSWEGITDKPSAYPPESHTHDDRYYTETEVDTALSGKSDTGHTHDDRYYTESETNTLLSAKADSYDVATALSAKADASSVYTKTQTDTLLNEKEDTANLGDLAYEDTVNYDTEVTNKPTLGALSELNTLNYTSELLTNKPTLGTMAQKNDANSDNKYYVRRNDAWVDADGRYYTESEVDTKLALKADKSSLGTLASQDDTGVDGKQYVRKDGAWEDLADTLSEKADIIHTSASGSLVHITDGAAYPVDSLTVDIDPVQDLHGYDNPWPAGGGKNLLDVTSMTQAKTNQGITATPNGDGTFALSGTAEQADINIWLLGNYDSQVTLFTLPAGTYTVTNVRLFNYHSGLGSVTPINGSAQYTFSEDQPITAVRVGQAVQGTNYTGTTLKPQIEKGSTATSWAPYSNICPISGHSTATVTRTGKNLWSLESQYDCLEGAFFINNVNFSLSAGTYTYTYTPSTSTGATTLTFLDSDGNTIYTNGGISNSVAKTTFTLTKDASKIRCYSNTALTLSNFQIEVGSKETSYESPHVQTVTIDLDGTRYGAQLDAVAGTLTVDRAIVTLSDISTLGASGTGTGKFATYEIGISCDVSKPLVCERMKSIVFANRGQSYQCYINPNAISSLQTFVPSDATVESVNTALSGSKVVIPLSTPTVITGLTLAQISLLLGENNVWSDTGDTTVGYRADTKLYIDKVLSDAVAQLQALILENS